MATSKSGTGEITILEITKFMEISNDGRVYGYAEVLDLLGGTNEALTEPYRLTAAGITFEPDPAAWLTLTNDERLAAMPRGWKQGHPVLAFPFSAAELLRFVEDSMLPALARWCEQDENDPAAFAMLESHPLGHGLAIFLAGGPDPTPEARPAAAEAVATAVDPGAPPTVEPDPHRRLRRLRELGGSIRWFRGKWEIEGIGALEKAERADGKTRCSAKTLRQDLHEAAKAEKKAERLIRAATVAQARNHAARDTLEVSVATQDQLVALLTGLDTVAVEDAAERETEPIPDDKQLSL